MQSPAPNGVALTVPLLASCRANRNGLRIRNPLNPPICTMEGKGSVGRRRPSPLLSATASRVATHGTRRSLRARGHELDTSFALVGRSFPWEASYAPFLSTWPSPHL